MDHQKVWFCEENFWAKEEADAAAALLRHLGRVAERQRETLRGKVCFVDHDAWLWPGGGPEYETLLGDASRECAGENQEREDLYGRVSQRLLDKKRRRLVADLEREMAEDLLTRARILRYLKWMMIVSLWTLRVAMLK